MPDDTIPGIEPPLRHADCFTSLWRPEEYAGQTWLDVQATQLEDSEARTATQKRRVLEGWIDLLSTGDTAITHLSLGSRTPQALLEAVAGVAHLQYLRVKWGPYEDLSPLSGLSQLGAVDFGNAGRIRTLEPLIALPRLTEVQIDGAFRLEDITELGRLTGLRHLLLGVGIGTDRSLHLPYLEWIRPLTKLTWLQLPGTIIESGDLSPAASLPELAVLGAPLRRQWREQVFSLAATNPAFAELAAAYQSYDEYRRQ